MDLSKKGFTGQAASNYFIETSQKVAFVQQAILSAGEELFTTPTKDKKPDPVYDFTMEKDYTKEYDRIVRDLGNAYSPDTVISDDNRYSYIGDLYQKYDQEMDEKIKYMISEMEGLCKDHFQIPSATPKVEATLEKIKNSLSESSELSNQTSKEMQKFAMEIAEIDGSSTIGLELDSNGNGR